MSQLASGGPNGWYLLSRMTPLLPSQALVGIPGLIATEADAHHTGDFFCARLNDRYCMVKAGSGSECHAKLIMDIWQG